MGASISNKVAAIVAIVAITIITGIAVASDLDGNTVVAAIAVLGGLGGYVAHQVNNKPKA